MANPIKHRLQLEIDTQKVSVSAMTEKIGRARSWWYAANDGNISAQDLVAIAKYLKKPVSYFLDESQDISPKNKKAKVELHLDPDDVLSIDIQGRKLQIFKK